MVARLALHRLLLTAVLSLTLLATACGQRTSGTDALLGPQAAGGTAGFGDSLPALPTDGVHVWESVDSSGYVIPGGTQQGEARSASAFPPSSELAAGRDRFAEGGDVVDNGEASMISAAAGERSYALYRLTMGGQQPGAVSVDVNLHPAAGGGTSTYWLGLSDYGTGRWQWIGPLTDGQLTLEVAAGQYLSTLGNLFVALMAHDGASLDAVAVAAAPRDAADTTAPPAPSAPQLTPVAGGLELEWLPVLAGDLAGYRIYYRYGPIEPGASTSDLRRVDYLENTTRTVIELPRRWTYVALTAVDVSGNESPLSPAASALPGLGSLPQLSVSVDTSSALRNAPATLTVSGAQSYDYDLDGDGVFEITGSAATSQSVDTSRTGIIRPRVRASAEEGSAVALGSVSLFVTGNSRPVASGTATPSSGYSPLTVIYNGEGHDSDGTIVEYAWDTIGDGIYDKSSPSAGGPHNRNLFTPGLYNAKFRVTDDQGAFDVDTVSIQVLANTMQVAFNPGYPDPGDPVLLTAQTPGPATLVEWDIDGDGTYELSSGASLTTTHSFTQPGRYLIGCRAALAAGGTLSGVTHVQVRGWRWEDSPDPTPGAGDTLSLLAVEGYPAIAYRINPAGTLMYVRANDPDGAAWGTPVELDPLDSAWPTMLIVNGNPAVAYRHPAAAQGVYVRATDSIGSSWSAPLELGFSVMSGAMPFTVVGASPGVPAVALADGTDLWFRRASDPNGAAWEPAVIVDNVNQPGAFASMTVVDGHPAISYKRDAVVDDLYYARADDPGGTLWGAPQGLHVGANDSGNHSSMAIVQGRPAIWSIDETAETVLFIQALDATGTTWPFVHRVLDSSSPFLASAWMDAKVIGGIPCFTYRRSPQIRFGRANDATAESWPEASDIKPSNNISSIAEIQGRPSIAVYGGNTLHFGKLY